jgi:hypothetical protein
LQYWTFWLDMEKSGKKTNEQANLAHSMHNVSKLTCYAARRNITEFAKLHMGLVVLVEKMSVLINFLLQNTKSRAKKLMNKQILHIL